MSLTSAAALPFPIPGVRFAKVFPHFDELGAAGQRLWMFLWDQTRFGTVPARVTDREMAQACGRGIRWVQKAMRQLLDLEEDGVPTPVIDRSRQYGPRHLAGRVIQIIIDFAKPADKPPQTKARAKATAKTSNPAPAKTPTPPPPPEPELSPEEAHQAAQWLRSEIARAKAEDDALRVQQRARKATEGPLLLPSKPIKGVDYDDLKYLEVKEQTDRPARPPR
jgi:hypothetical protein